MHIHFNQVHMAPPHSKNKSHEIYKMRVIINKVILIFHALKHNMATCNST